MYLADHARLTPDKPAMKMPTAKFKERNARTLMPSPATVSRSSVPARIRVPMRVNRRKLNSPVTTTATISTMNRR